mmetsp:Transcript_17950/g.34536  ORF Transcript_17950/g.34536 Transcript_17950/m.34536 type:complete len:131 (+) Transcript_17950:722-1114(+)
MMWQSKRPTEAEAVGPWKQGQHSSQAWQLGRLVVASVGKRTSSCQMDMWKTLAGGTGCWSQQMFGYAAAVHWSSAQRNYFAGQHGEACFRTSPLQVLPSAAVAEHSTVPALLARPSVAAVGGQISQFPSR